MKNKWVVIIILLAIVLLNPSNIGNISNFIKKQDTEIDIIKNINTGKNYKSIVYDKTVVYFDGTKLTNIDTTGKELFNINLKIENYTLDSNKYIDVLDKDNNIIYSINNNGKIVFKKNVPKDGLMYKSIKEDVYVYAYKKDEKNRVIIYDNDQRVINDIEVDGLITNLEYSSDSIYIVTINTKDKLSSKINKYDYNGNLKNSKEIEESVLLDLNLDKETLNLIYNNKISEMDTNLEIKNDVETGNIKLYSEKYENGRYIMEEDYSINYVDNKIKHIEVYEEEPKGIINRGAESIVYTKNKLFTIKNKQISEFKEDIIKVMNVKENIYAVNLTNSIQLIKVQ